MKKIIGILACACFFGVVTASAQQDKKIMVGLKGGLNVPDLTTASDNPLSDGWSSKLGGIYGLTFEYRFNKTWSLVSGLEYTEMGGKKDGLQALPSARLEPNINAGVIAATVANSGGQFTPDMINVAPWPNKYTYADFSNESKFNYLQIPVMARYSLPFGQDRFRFVVNFGGYVAYMVEAKNINSGTSQLYSDENKTPLTLDVTTPLGPIPPVPFTAAIPLNDTRNIYDQTRHFNVGVIGGAGVGMNLWKGELMLQAGGQYGFVKIQKDDKNGQNRIGAGTFTLSYAIAL